MFLLLTLNITFASEEIYYKHKTMDHINIFISRLKMGNFFYMFCQYIMHKVGLVSSHGQSSEFLSHWNFRNCQVEIIENSRILKFLKIYRSSLKHYWKHKYFINPFLPNFHFWSPWKHQKAIGCFQGDQKETLGRKGSIH